MEGKQIELNASDYPELSGVKEGDTIKKMTIMDSKVAAADEASGALTVEFGPTQIEMEGSADKALRETVGPRGDAVPASDEGEDE